MSEPGQPIKVKVEIKNRWSDAVLFSATTCWAYSGLNRSEDQVFTLSPGIACARPVCSPSARNASSGP